MSNKKPLFSIIMLTFDRPKMLKEAVEGFFAQTYSNWEAVIIDNAATPQTRDYLSLIERQDSRIKLVHFKTNQYDPKDPMKYVGICYNAALDAAKGDYVWDQADDDFISPNFVERMVDLFQGNPECTTAAGLPVSVDVNGNVIPGPRLPNCRPRYMPGHLLALETLRKGGTNMFAAPGTIFAIKRDVLIKAGGYHPAIEKSHLYGIVPFGLTGFDESAILYWRRHEGQLNLSLMASGYVGLKGIRNLLNEWDIQKRWEDRFGKLKSSFVVRSLIRRQYEVAAACFIHNIYAMSWVAAWRIFCQAGGSYRFWKKIPYCIWDERGILKMKLKSLFGLK